MIDELMTWSKLLTFSGLVITTCVITSFIKGLISKIPTQVISWGVACALLCTATIVVNGAMPWYDWILAAVNSITISLTANGTYSACTRKKDSGGGDNHPRQK